LGSATQHNLSNNSLRHGPFANVLALGDFERFVYVLAVLEEYTDRECSVLLKSSLQEIEQTRSRALQQMAEIDSEGTLRQK
jgi:DNA-directed RNA polymerase specialized sigma24 family protein